MYYVNLNVSASVDLLGWRCGQGRGRSFELMPALSRCREVGSVKIFRTCGFDRATPVYKAFVMSCVLAWS